MSFQWTCSVDRAVSEKADKSVVAADSQSWTEQSAHVEKQLADVLDGEKLDAILCVAGSWKGGNTADEGEQKASKQSMNITHGMAGSKMLARGPYDRICW